MSKAKTTTDFLHLASKKQPDGRVWKRVLRAFHRNFVAPLTLSKHPPRFDARGVAAGLVVGFGVPVGGHILTLTALRTLVRFNYLVAIAFTWVCNPFNMIFVYYGYYCLGSVMLGKSVAMDLDAFKKIFSPVLDKTYFWEGLSDFTQLGAEMLVRWFVAATALAVVSGLVGYVVAYRLQSLRCKRAAEKMGVEYEAYVQELEATMLKRVADRRAD
jgi:uncharacterized protein (DUF2062 family)